MIQLCYNTARSAYPIPIKCGLQIAIVITAFDYAAVIRPLTDNTARIIRVIAINSTIIDTIPIIQSVVVLFDCVPIMPPAKRLVALLLRWRPTNA